MFNRGFQSGDVAATWIFDARVRQNPFDHKAFVGRRK